MARSDWRHLMGEVPDAPRGTSESHRCSRGHRIELGEIEARLAQHPAVCGAVVLASSGQRSSPSVPMVDNGRFARSHKGRERQELSDREHSPLLQRYPDHARSKRRRPFRPAAPQAPG